MAGKSRTWIWVIAGIVVVGILCVIAMAAAGLYFFSRNIDTHEVSPAMAEREFAEVRTKFTGQKPLIELDSHGELLRTNPDRPEQKDPRRPQTLYVLAFEPEEGRIVKVNIPFWLLRFKTGNATIDLNGSRMDLEDLKLTVEDLERLGPTLIIDHTMTSGEHVLVWSQ
jgi:hypothetical protein